MNLFFSEYIETSLESLPVIQATHTERKNGCEFRFTQTVHRNVYTEFDHKLSRYLSATRGDGFPAFTVKIEICETKPDSQADHLVSVFHESLPNALIDIAKRAVDRVGTVELAIQRSISNNGKQPPVSHKRKMAPGDVAMLDTALGICRTLGDLDFLEISGDFGAIVATPPGKLNPVILHLQNGSVMVPSAPTGTDAPFQWPVYAFAQNASANVSVQSYLASVGQMIVAEKEASILEFRSAAERRIVDFQRALGERSLEGHWLKGAKGLVARLKQGLGDNLAGISEDAQGMALEMSAAVESSTTRGNAASAPAEEPEMLLVNPTEETEMLLVNPAEEPEMLLTNPSPAPGPEVALAEPAPEPEMTVADPTPESEMTWSDSVPGPEMELAEPAPEPEELLDEPAPEPEIAMAETAPESEVAMADPAPEPEVVWSDPALEPEVAVADPPSGPKMTWAEPVPEPEMEWVEPDSEPKITVADHVSQSDVAWAEPAPEPEMEIAELAPEPELAWVEPAPEAEEVWAARDPAPEPQIRLVASAPEPEVTPANPDEEPEVMPDDSAPYRQMPLLLGDLAL